MRLTRRSIFVISAVLFLLTSRGEAGATEPPPHPAPASGVQPTSDEVKAALISGNDRFVHGLSRHPHQGHNRVVETGTSQHPVVTVLSCSDSRVPPELLFDEGLGDVFAVRVAGNVVDTDEMGSIEYGVEHLGTPLLVVMGHTKCGAVTAVATHAVVHGHIPALVSKIGPAVEAAHAKSPGASDAEIVPEAIRANVFNSMEILIRNSDAVRERIASRKTHMVGAVYDITTGTVAWLGPHPDEARLTAEAKPSESKESEAKASEGKASEPKHGEPKHGDDHGQPKHGDDHGAHTAPSAHAADHADDANKHAEDPDHATKEMPEAPPSPSPSLPIAFAMVTLAATIGGAVSGRLSKR